MPIMLSILLAIISLAIMAYRKRYFQTYDQNGPVVTVKARLIRKETHTSTHIDANGEMMTDEVYQLVFSLDTSGEIAFRVSQKVYGNTPENRWGTLAYQGTRFLGFEFISEDNG